MDDTIGITLIACKSKRKYSGLCVLERMTIDISDVQMKSGNCDDIIFRFSRDPSFEPEITDYDAELRFNPDVFWGIYMSKLKRIILENKKLKEQLEQMK